MENLPTELVLEIPQHLHSQRDVASLARVSRRIYRIINPMLYKRDASSGKPTAPFWAAERGMVPTLGHARAAGVDLDETRMFPHPRRHMADVDPVENSRGCYEASIHTAFLDWGFAGIGPRFWWHPLDIAAFFGHANVVRYLAGLGISVSLSRSRGLCRFNCRPGRERAREKAKAKVIEEGASAQPAPARGENCPEWTIHSAAEIAACAGHVDVAVLIDELGHTQSEDLSKKEKAEGQPVEESEVLSYRDFVLERF